ncbi:MAG: grasp-with-spasm system SPASM domain peptide maturase [Bacteroidia bacterium]|nr:grasp-with-spasm system SPASM domain peptide maturase [Bacteroidia bacterium]
MELPVMTRTDNKCFMLFASCIPVKGFAKSIIADIQREQYLPVPNLLADILIENRGVSIGEIKNRYQHQYDEGLDSYFQELARSEWGFFTEDPDCFPPLSLEWDHPSAITHAILDIDQSRHYELTPVIKELDEQGCKALQIRGFGEIDTLSMEEWLEAAEDTGIFSLEMILPLSAFRSVSEAEKMILRYCRIVSLTLYGAENEGFANTTHPASEDIIYLTRQAVTPYSKELSGPEFFTTNIHAFTEAQHFNLGLNRKITVDIRGNIRHFPGHSRVFGHISSDTLTAVVGTKEFQAVWQTPVDKIENCKECEFRYMCADNSEVVQKGEKIYRLTTCTYNPRTGEWQ